MIRTFSQISSTVIALSLSTAAMADWPVALPDKKTIHPIQFVRVYNDGLERIGHREINVLSNDIGTDIRIIETNAWTAKGGKTEINNATRRIVYSPPANFAGEDTFWYVMQDSQGRKNAAKVTVTVKPAGSRFPDPANDKVSVQKNKSIRINVLKNDVYLNRIISAKISQFNQWSQKGGRIKLEDGELIYTPPSNFTGTDTFWYVLKSPTDFNFNGDNSVEHAAKVTIRVADSNQAGPYPSTKADFATVTELPCTIGGRYCPGATYDFYVTTNDVGKNLIVTTDSSYSKNGGRISTSRETVLSSARISYTASDKAIREGKDTFWYTIEDEVGRKNWGVVNMNIIPKNQ